MAQEASGIPYQTSTPETSIGAVYFDNQIDPLSLHLRNLDTINAAEQRRKAEYQQRTAQAYKLLEDLNPKVEGIMSNDTEYFRNKAQELQQYRAGMLQTQMNPNDPAFQQAYVKGTDLEKQLEIEAQGSKADKEYLSKILTEYDPAKHDPKSLSRIEEWSKKPFSERQQYDRSQLLVPKTIDLFGEVQKKMKALPKSQNLVRDEKGNLVTEKLPFGGTGYYTEEKLGDADLNALNNVLSQDPELVRSATEQFNLLPPNSPQRVSISEEANRRGLDPSQVMIERASDAANTSKAILKEAKEGTAYKEAVKYGYKKKAEDEKASYILEQLGNVYTGKTRVYNQLNTTPTTWDAIASGNAVTMQTLNQGGQQVWYSNALAGISAGSFNVQKEDSNGNITLDTEPNNIIGWKYMPDGSVYVKTAQSMYMKGQGVNSIGGVSIDDEGYQLATDNVIAGIAVANKLPLESVRRVLTNANGYDGNVANVRVMAKPNEPTIQTPAKAEPKKTGGAITQEEWNKKWAALPKGGAMEGLDGKTYIKK